MDGRREGPGQRWSGRSDKPVSSYASLASGPPPTYASSSNRQGSGSNDGNGSWDNDDKPFRQSYHGGRGRGRYDGGGRASSYRGGGGGRERYNERTERFSGGGGIGGDPPSPDRSAYEDGEILPINRPLSNPRRGTPMEERSTSSYDSVRGGSECGRGRFIRGGRGVRGGRYFDRGGRSGRSDLGRGGGRSDYRGRGRSDDPSSREPYSSGKEWKPAGGNRLGLESSSSRPAVSTEPVYDDRSNSNPRDRTYPARETTIARGSYSSLLGAESDVPPIRTYDHRSEDNFAKRRRDDVSFPPSDYEEKRARSDDYLPGRGRQNDDVRGLGSAAQPPLPVDSRPRMASSELRGIDPDRRALEPRGGFDAPRGETSGPPPPAHNERRGRIGIDGDGSYNEPRGRLGPIDDEPRALCTPIDEPRLGFRDGPRGQTLRLPGRDDSTRSLPPITRDDNFRSAPPPPTRRDDGPRGRMPPPHEEFRGSSDNFRSDLSPPRLTPRNEFLKESFPRDTRPFEERASRNTPRVFESRDAPRNEPKVVDDVWAELKARNQSQVAPPIARTSLDMDRDRDFRGDDDFRGSQGPSTQMQTAPFRKTWHPPSGNRSPIPSPNSNRRTVVVPGGVGAAPAFPDSEMKYSDTRAPSPLNSFSDRGRGRARGRGFRGGRGRGRGDYGRFGSGGRGPSDFYRNTSADREGPNFQPPPTFRAVDEPLFRSLDESWTQSSDDWGKGEDWGKSEDWGKEEIVEEPETTSQAQIPASSDDQQITTQPLGIVDISTSTEAKPPADYEDKAPTNDEPSPELPMEKTVEKEVEVRPISPPPPGKPSGVLLAMTRLADLEAQMEYAYAKHMQLVSRQNELKAQIKLLATLPVGIDAIKEELDSLA